MSLKIKHESLCYFNNKYFCVLKFMEFRSLCVEIYGIDFLCVEIYGILSLCVEIYGMNVNCGVVCYTIFIDIYNILFLNLLI